MSRLRFRVVETAFKKKPLPVAVPAERPSEYFAKYVFNREKMFKYLSSTTYAKLTDVIDNGAPLDRSIADERGKAIAYHDNVVPVMEQIRYHIDKLELIVDDQLWTLPKYRELLFIR